MVLLQEEEGRLGLIDFDVMPSYAFFCVRVLRPCASQFRLWLEHGKFTLFDILFSLSFSLSSLSFLFLSLSHPRFISDVKLQGSEEEEKRTYKAEAQAAKGSIFHTDRERSKNNISFYLRRQLAAGQVMGPVVVVVVVVLFKTFTQDLGIQP